MKSSKTSFLRNCISGWNVRGKTFVALKSNYYLCHCKRIHLRERLAADALYKASKNIDYYI